ncbi:hypothetical protein [Micromonospora robiginosa]|uniref:Uncharacterized protein n=1 Tax=Micromonospora robiginosa TaxID=2749844 RepID=A0AAF0T0B1_9ACTN|nr:hypothetical protein [Micromonospora ferruginea]WMF04482.1 hypothetical protein H1D33_30085 [Micromonospora ferruginea]
MTGGAAVGASVRGVLAGAGASAEDAAAACRSASSRSNGPICCT